MKKEELIEELETLPGKIKGKEEEYLDCSKELEIAEGSIKEIENTEKVKIKKEKDEEGKKKYKNKLERKTALNKELDSNKVYQQLSDNKKRLEETKKRLEMEINFLRRKNANNRGIAYLLSDVEKE